MLVYILVSVVACSIGELVCVAEEHTAPVKSVRWIAAGNYTHFRYTVDPRYSSNPKPH